MSLNHRRSTRNNRLNPALWSRSPAGTVAMAVCAPAIGIKPPSLAYPTPRISYRARPVLATTAVLAVIAAIFAVWPTGPGSTTGHTRHTVQKRTAQTIPSGLARAIHARLGRAPLGLGVAPMVAGIEREGGGWKAAALSGKVQLRIGASGAVNANLSGQTPVRVRLAAVTSDRGPIPLAPASSRLAERTLVQDLGSVRSTFQVISGGVEQRFVIPRAPTTEPKTAHLELRFSSSAQWSVLDGGSEIAVSSGRSHLPRLAWRALSSIDATGKPLPSRFTEGMTGPVITVDATNATYPLTIDPTWTSTAAPQAVLSNGDGLDRFGGAVVLSGDGTTAAVSAGGANNDLGAVSIFHASSEGAWSGTASPVATLTYSGGVEKEGLGPLSLSSDGTTLLVGVPFDGTGAVLIYHASSESSWASTSTPAAVLTNSSDTSGANFGASVSISPDGTTALIGASGALGHGAAYIYNVSSESAWATTSTPTATLVNASGSSGDSMGTSVSLSASGTIAFVGADEVSSGKGAVYVYQTTAESLWVSMTTPSATLTSSSGGAMGYSLAASSDGTTVVAGAIEANSAAGLADVFQVAVPQSGQPGWTSTATPTATLSEPTGQNQTNFGETVSISADKSVILVGAPNLYNQGAGAAYVFQAAGGTWTSSSSPAATLTSSAGGSKAELGYVALSSDGTLAVAGAPNVNSGTGAAYLYLASSETTWASTSTPAVTLSNGAPPGVAFDYFGDAVAISADGLTALVGANGAPGAPNGNGNPSYRGVAYIFHVSSVGSWTTTTTPTATLTDSASANGDNFGAAVALSPDGATAFVGAWGVNQGTGSAYVFHASSASSWATTSTPTAVLTNSTDVANNNFGVAVTVSTDGTTALIGDDCANTCKGAADIYHVSSETAWTTTSTPTAVLTNSGDATYDYFGDAVALSADGTTALIGDYYFPNDSGLGSAYIYQAASEASWSSTSTPTSNLTNQATGSCPTCYVWFGESVALSPDGTIALVGAPYASPGGAAYIYQASSETSWSTTLSPTATLSYSAGASGDYLGWATAMSSGDVALVSAYGANNTNGETMVYEAQAAPSQLAFTTQPPSSTAEGQSFSVAVSVEDSSGNVATSDSSTSVNLAITAGTGASGATLTCAQNPVTDHNGVADFSCSIDKPAAGYTLTATATGLSPATSNSFTVTVAPSQLAFTTQPPSSTAEGQSFSVAVSVEDSSGNVATSDSSTSVNLAITAGTGASGATLTCAQNPVTDHNGVADFSCSIDKPAAGYTLTATATGLSPATSN